MIGLAALFIEIIIERVEIVMKKGKGAGIVIGLIMIVIIIIGGVHKKVFNCPENNRVIRESTDNQAESTKETMQRTEYENKDAQSKVSLRNYDFEVKKTDYHRNESESNYLEVQLIITNNALEEKVMSLNSISLIIYDSEGNEIERFQLGNVNDVDAKKVGIDYFLRQKAYLTLRPKRRTRCSFQNRQIAAYAVAQAPTIPFPILFKFFQRSGNILFKPFLPLIVLKILKAF